MAECSRCRIQTQLHVNGVPVCPECDDFVTRRQERPAGAEMTKAVVTFSAPN
jgi:hypothetical protein